MTQMDRKMLKTKEVAVFCGVSSRTVAIWLRKGQLKGVKLNGFSWRVKTKDLIAFLEQEANRVQPK